MKFDEIERRLRRQRLPEAPEALATRLAAAVSALPIPQAIAWSDRLWFSRAARLGWAAAVLLLLAVEIARAPGKASPSRPERTGASSQVVGLAIDLSLDPVWSERLVAAESPADSGRDDIQAAVNAL